MNQAMIIQNNTLLEAAMGKYLKVSHVAERYNVSPRTVLRWIHDGFLPGAFKLNPLAKNSHFVVPEEDLKTFEESRKSSLNK